MTFKTKSVSTGFHVTGATSNCATVLTSTPTDQPPNYLIVAISLVSLVQAVSYCTKFFGLRVGIAKICAGHVTWYSQKF